MWNAEDLLLELELLTRIARLALLQNNHSLVCVCVCVYVCVCNSHLFLPLKR